jgi:5'-deoxynucleotidase YfbR-like HD superfamily hydrolase
MLDLKAMLTGSTGRLAHINRYSSIPCTHPETVAEHQYYVALYCLLIGNDIRMGYIDVAMALKTALVHDIEECLTGDFLRSFKKSTPILDKEISEASAVCAEKVFKELVGPQEVIELTGYWNNAKDHGISGRLVKFCDFLSVVGYLAREAVVGNRFAELMLKTEVQTYANSFNFDLTFSKYLTEVQEIIDGGWDNVRVTS